MIIALTRRVAPADSYEVTLLLQFALVAPPLLLPSALYFALVEKPCMRRDWPRRLLERVRGALPAPGLR